MNVKKKGDAGFTLLELLIVISIIAILAVALVLVLNPAETLRKSRDAQRISDLSTIRTALGLYLTSTSSPKMSEQGTACQLTRSSTTTAVFLTNNTGWIDVNLDSLTGGSPISNLPRDPLNDTDHAYWYKCSGTTFEVSTLLESAAYGIGGTDDKGSKDGGNESTRYEVGTNLTL